MTYAEHVESGKLHFCVEFERHERLRCAQTQETDSPPVEKSCANAFAEAGGTRSLSPSIDA